MTTERVEGAAAIRQQIARTEVWRIAIAVLWFGMIAAISFLEAPLKFQAPGITIPLGLGIGRLVFAALNVAEVVMLVAFSVLAMWPSAARLAGRRMWVWLSLALVLVVKLIVVRPPLNARTDLVLQGADPGQSPWHYIYIACDVVTMVLLMMCAVQASRGLLRLVTARDEEPALSARTSQM